jgi:hypothetical protein
MIVNTGHDQTIKLLVLLLAKVVGQYPQIASRCVWPVHGYVQLAHLPP